MLYSRLKVKRIKVGKASSASLRKDKQALSARLVKFWYAFAVAVTRSIALFLFLALTFSFTPHEYQQDFEQLRQDGRQDVQQEMGQQFQQLKR